MKNALVVIAVGVVVALALRVEAAEDYLGTIFTTDAGFTHNLFPTDGGAFAITPTALVTIQPTAAAYVCVDTISQPTHAPACTAANSVQVAANAAFPSSCKTAQNVLMADGGMVTGCIIQCGPVSGTSVNCAVFQRKGNEF